MIKFFKWLKEFRRKLAILKANEPKNGIWISPDRPTFSKKELLLKEFLDDWKKPRWVFYKIKRFYRVKWQFSRLPKIKIHETIGVYPDGSSKSNGVYHKNLWDHIWYNIHMRPGRALFVDGVCFESGSLTRTECERYSKKFKENQTRRSDTQPYH